ncbi:mandelate racemase/muconate lactonizing enzyme family protein [Ornithinimicrobium cerasi]|uniref:L-alanine-DL-glutamate epimerase n=1 Tax=Ornithinimicrobium cerasi TaxID=2248773 RepID=A0A285VQ40_9MICO|nr:mandelate racemase/muconate lactonizing enzyme family protein [Ornithinimicrobium cerasi]SOC56073.1 L-alanine-DL-glutamate epimerase [Ornithinimicrobium cerasi]
MRIVEVRERTFPISSPIRNAVVDFSQMTLSLAAVITDEVRDGRRVVGFGFNSNGRYGQGSLMRERFVPRLTAAAPDDLLDDDGLIDPHRAWDVLMTNEKPGGHGERSVAVGVLDMALWDLRAKLEGRPLYDLIAEKYGTGAPDRRVFVYAAGGYYHPGKGTRGLKDELLSYLDRGYTVVKMKIGGAPLAEDLERVEAALSVLGPGQRLMVDANGRFDAEEATAYLTGLESYDLHWYEEPTDPLDYHGLNQVAERRTSVPLATGENLFSSQDALNLARYGGLDPERDYLQFDCALSYGLVEYLRTLESLRPLGWEPSRFIPHGGHQMSLNIAAGLGLGGNESYPDLFQPFGGFPDGVEVEDGHITMPELAGIGFEGKADLAAVCASLVEDV